MCRRCEGSSPFGVGGLPAMKTRIFMGFRGPGKRDPNVRNLEGPDSTQNPSAEIRRKSGKKIKDVTLAPQGPTI